MENRDAGSRENAEPVIKYKAILDPERFDNAVFWKGIADYEGGKLEEQVIFAEDRVKSSLLKRQLSPFHPDGMLIAVCYPSLEELVFMLTGPRIGLGKSDEERAYHQIISQSLIPDTPDKMNSAERVIGQYFNRYCNSNAKPTRESEWYTRPNVGDAYPGFIGHKDFVVPGLRQRPMSARFWLSVIAMVGGAAALVVAFALLHAATLAVSGTVVAGVGVAALLGGFSLFRTDRAIMAAETQRLNESISSWRPVM